MGGFAAFATGFVGGLNKMHENAQEQEAEWLTKAGERFDERYKAKKEYDGKVAERARKVQAAAAYFDGDEDMAIVAVDSGLDYTNPEIWERLRKSRPGKTSPAAQQTQKSGMAPAPAPTAADQQNLGLIKPTPTQQDQVKAPPQAGPQQQAKAGPRKELAPVPEVFKPTIEALAERTKLDPAVIGAVFMTESGARPEVINGTVKSSAGAVGPMQTIPDTLRDPGYGVVPARDNSVDEQWRVGADYLAAMQRRYKDLPTALAAYNWGPGSVDKWLASGADPAKMPAETRKYIDTVMSRLPGARPVGPTKEAAQTQQVLGQTPTETQGGSAAATPSVTTAPTSNAMEQPPTDSQEAPEGRSGWQVAGDLITGRRDPREVADRGAVKAGSQYGLSPEESMEVMRGDYIGSEQTARPGTRIGFGDKPVDQTAIASEVVKNLDNFPDGIVQSVALKRLAAGDIEGALSLADPMAMEREKARLKSQSDSTTAYETKVLIAERMSKEKKIPFGKAWGIVNGSEGVRTDPVKGGFSYVDDASGTVAPTQTVDQAGNPTTQVSKEDNEKAKAQVINATNAIVMTDTMLAAIDDNPNNVGLAGQAKQLFGQTFGQIPGEIGEWAQGYADLDEISTMETNKAILTGYLMPSITGDTSRFSEADRKMVEDARGKLMAPDATATAVKSSLKAINLVQRRGRANALKMQFPNEGEKQLAMRLAKNYAQTKSKEEAIELAKEDIMGLRMFGYGQ